MKRSIGLFFLCVGVLFIISVTKALTDEKHYDGSPPFKLDLLDFARIKTAVTAAETPVYDPRNPYNIFINYELGMHCVGFDISYCCIIPPYNSIQAQAVRSGVHSEKPQLLSPGDKVGLHYRIRDNSYSEGNKMRYWQVP